MRQVYLDNAATTMVLPEAVEAVTNAMQSDFGNPSSLHRMGLEAEKVVERAREQVAKSIGAEKKQVFFLSGGTEGNNLALRGGAEYLLNRGRHVVTTAVEHPSVLATCETLGERGWTVTVLPVDSSGVVDVKAVAEHLRDETVLVSVMLVNNEVGSVQPVEEIGRLLSSRPNTFYHVDAVQALGKVPMNVKKINADFLTLSAHKVHGPKGVGAIFVRNPERIMPQLTGGGQEHNLRSGTENVPGIAGFGAAVAHIDGKAPERMSELKVRLTKGIAAIPDVLINGPDPEGGAPHILNASFLGVRGEVLVHALEAHGIFVSTGSACSSRRTTVSHVLKALGIGEERASGSIRFSLSRFTTKEDIDYTVEKLVECVEQLRRFQRR